MSKPVRKNKPLPRFASESEERVFWEAKENDATD